MTIESLIRDMVKNGTKTEDIAKQAADALNAINQEKKEEKEKEEKRVAEVKRDREEYLNKLQCDFDTAYRDKNIKIENIAALCAVVCAKDHPDWTRNDIEELVISAQMSIKTVVSLVKRDLDQSFSDLINDILKEVPMPEYPNKRKEDKKVTAGPIGNSRPCTCKRRVKSPEDILLDFLKTL